MEGYEWHQRADEAATALLQGKREDVERIIREYTEQNKDGKAMTIGDMEARTLRARRRKKRPPGDSIPGPTPLLRRGRFFLFVLFT